MASKKRERLHAAMDGRCGYCGTPISIREMDIDHMQSRERRGTDDDANLIAACKKCNNLKMTFSVEEFRVEVAAQVERGRKYSVNFRTAERFGLINATSAPVVFYFERRPTAKED